GIAPVSTTPVNARLVLHYNETFNETIGRMLSPKSAYDAFYLIAYAVHALPAPGPTGAKLAATFERLRGPAATAVEVGPSGIVNALNTLRRGEKIELRGATGSLAMDPNTGAAPTDLAIVCPGGEKGEEASGMRESGMVYRAATSQLEGEILKCPR